MQLILADRRHVADGTMAFWFQPERALTFRAGQFGEFTVAGGTHTDAKGNTRSFSLANAPGSDGIMIATRMRGSAFKQNMGDLPIGAGVSFMGPMGSFTLHEDPSRPAVFLVGGIGITPVRSIVEHATRERLAHKLYVFYSNKTRSRAAFLDDFREWGRENPNLTFIPTLSGERPEQWPFELGAIDEPMLGRHIGNLQHPDFYIAGPPPMVAAMKELLTRAGADEKQIKAEDFAGY